MHGLVCERPLCAANRRNAHASAYSITRCARIESERKFAPHSNVVNSGRCARARSDAHDCPTSVSHKRHLHFLQTIRAHLMRHSSSAHSARACADVICVGAPANTAAHANRQLYTLLKLSYCGRRDGECGSNRSTSSAHYEARRDGDRQIAGTTPNLEICTRDRVFIECTCTHVWH